MVKSKRCSGCKSELSVDNFYKNKSTLDGHSIYCKSCTKINSKKYFENKKIKNHKIDGDILLKFMNSNFEPNRSENLMKVLMIEKLCKSILEELESLKKNIVHLEV